MKIEILKSKIHRVTITGANLHYMGSITIDEDLMEAANLVAYEKVTIADIDNGERFDTYVIKGERGSGTITINGAAAHKVNVGHLIIIMAYATMTPEEAGTFKPSIIFPDSKTNKLIS
jgi:aspartate 1-decarboxylase